MSKQSIYVRHKDGIFQEYKDHINWMIEYLNCPDKNKKKELWQINHGHLQGYKQALEWVLGLDKTKEQKDQEFSDKIDALTNKGESNEERNTKE